MLKRVAALVFALLVLCSAFLLPVSAESSDPFDKVSFSLPEGYKTLTRSNLSKNSDLVKMIGYTASSLKDHMIKEDIYYIGVGEGVKGEFHIKSWQNEFSKTAESFSGFDNSGLAELNQSLFGGNAEICTVGKSDTVYFRTKSKLMESEFYTYQYTTVENGRFYSFIYYGNSSKEIDEMIKTVNFKKQAAPLSTSAIIVIIVMAICIILGLVAMGVLAMGIVRDIRKKSNEPQSEEEQPMKIKRRKM